jgi:dTMP kinase
MFPMTECLLYAASRAQHVREVILPSLKGGVTVISDRFTDSNTAYQGAARGIDINVIETINQYASGITPDITFLLDISPGNASHRKEGPADRIESEQVEFFIKVRNGFLDIAKNNPERVAVLDAGRDPGVLSKEIIGSLIERRWVYEACNGDSAGRRRIRNN